MGSAIRAKTAFVLSGGGNLGAVQVGMLRGLLEAGIQPDAVVGTSIGALNGAFLAGHNDLAGIDALTELWSSVRRSDAFPLSIWTFARGILGFQPFIFESLGLRNLLARAQIGFERLEDSPIPLRVIATDIHSGEPVSLAEGDTARALLASSAIPGIFPSVEIEGRALFDGAVAANTPIMQAEALNPSDIYVLPTMPDYLGTVPTQAILMIQRAMTLSVKEAERRALQGAANRRRVWVLPVPDIAGRLSTFDFGSTSRLIEDAYNLTTLWLEHDPASRPISQISHTVATAPGAVREEVAA